jgi:uncharacterized protein (UPF0332 family)
MRRGMERGPDQELLRSKLEQARDSLQEARSLLEEGAELRFVMNNLYFAFLYPVLGLLKVRGIPADTQSSALSLFEREFVEKGVFERRFLEAFRLAFRLRPACACESPAILTRQDVEDLLPIARDFISAVGKMAS